MKLFVLLTSTACVMRTVVFITSVHYCLETIKNASVDVDTSFFVATDFRIRHLLVGCGLFVGFLVVLKCFTERNVHFHFFHLLMCRYCTLRSEILKMIVLSFLSVSNVKSLSPYYT